MCPDDFRERLIDPLQAIAERILDFGDDGALDNLVERAVLECLASDPLRRALR